VQTARHALLYDTGPRWGPGQDAAARVLLPSLRAAGVRRLDRLLLSHGDADHAGGLASLRAGLPVAELWSPPDPRLVGHAACEAGRRWTWDGVHFELLHPPPGTPPRTGNENGCVLRVQAARSVLLAADIGRAQELSLLPQLQPVDLLLLAHHGSASSSAPEFLAALQPQLAFAQSGYRNRHGHPALAVQTRLRLAGIALLTSAQCGAFDWRSDVPTAAASCWREQGRRYWHQRFDASFGHSADTLEGPPLAP
jgi:competence protein ComEC